MDEAEATISSSANRAQQEQEQEQVLLPAQFPPNYSNAYTDRQQEDSAPARAESSVNRRGKCQQTSPEVPQTNSITSPGMSTMNRKYDVEVDQANNQASPFKQQQQIIASLQSKREELGISTAEGMPRDMFDTRL